MGYFEAFLFQLQDQAWFIDFTLGKSGVKQGFNVFLKRNRENPHKKTAYLSVLKKREDLFFLSSILHMLG